VRALGIDVGAGKGLDLVVLDERRLPIEVLPRVGVDRLAALIRRLAPDVVAIDAPPAWATTGSSRLTERILLELNIHSFNTPAARNGRGHGFYEWMEVGFRVFRAAARAGFPRYGAGEPSGTALEVFPHASAAVLAGGLPPKGVPKRAWRVRLLRAQGVRTDDLRSADLVDAGLCALTGLLALQGKHVALGDPREGVIVLPVAALPARPYLPLVREAADGAPPLFRYCACGDPACREPTRGEFAPGHDAKRKSMLWRRAREGADAVAELRSRGWKVPPEIG
jgi:predicted nuclease with RNAse H fold